MTIITQPAAPPLAPAKSGEAVDPVYRQIRDLVYKVSGIYKAEEKLYLLADGCGRRMKQLSVRNPREYWDQLTSQPGRDGELRQLLNEITIGETCLFRSQPQLDALRKVILPEIVAEKTKQITKRLRNLWRLCAALDHGIFQAQVFFGRRGEETAGTPGGEKTYRFQPA